MIKYRLGKENSNADRLPMELDEPKRSCTEPSSVAAVIAGCSYEDDDLPSSIVSVCQMNTFIEETPEIFLT